MLADNFQTLASHFPHLNPPPFNGFSQHALHALSQQALPQQPFSQPSVVQHATDQPRSSSLPLRFSPQAGLYDANPNSLLHALRAHGAPSHLLGLHSQAEAMQQQPHLAMLPGRINSLKQELPERELSDASLSGTQIFRLQSVTTPCSAGIIQSILSQSRNPRPSALSIFTCRST